MGHLGMDSQGYGEVKFYEKAFGELPDAIKLLAEKLAVKQMVAALHGEKMEAARAHEQVLRNEFAAMAEEIETLKLDLRQACHNHVKNKENL